jgi:hypothetical protein
MKVVFSFDTEDFVTPEAADAQKWWAETLAARSLRGSFQCVGEVIRRLKTRGRDDVIAAIAQHEIGFHTQYHSMPPIHPVAVESLPLDEAVSWVLRREAAGVAELAQTFGRMPVSYCPPGDSWTPATLIAMAGLGIRLFVGNQFARPHWYCGLLGVKYDLCLEGYFTATGAGEEAFQRDFDALVKTKGDAGVIVLYSHPTRLVTSRFWDAPLYGGRQVALADMPPAPLVSPEGILRNKAAAERMLDWVTRHPAVECTDFASLYAACAGSRRDLPALLQAAGLKPGEEGRLPLRDESGGHEEMADYLARFEYHWPPFPADFTGSAIRRQMRCLAWTLQPAL